MDQQLYKKILTTKILKPIAENSSRVPQAYITGFCSLKGKLYNQRIMVVGRAVNGWRGKILPTQLEDNKEKKAFAKKILENQSHNECPMLWVNRCWGGDTPYNTKRSAFWRCIKKTLDGLKLVDTSENNWASYLVWSNLYKIAPSTGGNPNPTLCRLQYEGCKDLLNLEIETYKPEKILFLTGEGWVTPFIEEASMQLAPESSTYVRKIGFLHGAHCVVAEHPMTKKESIWVNEVVEAYKNLAAATS